MFRTRFLLGTPGPRRAHVAGDHADREVRMPQRQVRTGLLTSTYMPLNPYSTSTDPYTHVADPIFYRRHTDVSSELQTSSPSTPGPSIGVDDYTRLA